MSHAVQYHLSSGKNARNSAVLAMGRGWDYVAEEAKERTVPAKDLAHSCHKIVDRAPWVTCASKNPRGQGAGCRVDGSDGNYPDPGAWGDRRDDSRGDEGNMRQLARPRCVLGKAHGTDLLVFVPRRA